VVSMVSTLATSSLLMISVIGGSFCLPGCHYTSSQPA
jgi:hypothetical protein